MRPDVPRPQFGASAYCGLTYLGLPLSNELDAGVGGGITYQRFERGVLGYDPQHKLDTPPGAGDVYVLHLDKGIGQDPRLATLQQQLLAVQAQYVALKNAQAQTVPTIAALTKNQQIVTQIKQLADQFVIS